MTHKSKTIQCQHFCWKLTKRKGVYYADGRSGNQFNLGKNSLGTRDNKEAMTNLAKLDLRKAIEYGLAEPDTHSRNNRSLVSIKEGWEEWYAFSGRDRTLGGVSDGSLQGYKNRGRKHLEYCKKNHIKTWNQFDDNWLSKYAKVLVKYAPSVKYDFLAMVKMANRRLVTLGRLSGNLSFKGATTSPLNTLSIEEYIKQSPLAFRNK